MIQNPDKAKLPKDESLIPNNTPYCYIFNGHSVVDGKIVLNTTTCPFWDFDDERHDQECGYCHFIEQGDWMEDGTLLLWDKCKECGINSC